MVGGCGRRGGGNNFLEAKGRAYAECPAGRRCRLAVLCFAQLKQLAVLSGEVGSVGDLLPAALLDHSSCYWQLLLAAYSLPGAGNV